MKPWSRSDKPKLIQAAYVTAGIVGLLLIAHAFLSIADNLQSDMTVAVSQLGIIDYEQVPAVVDHLVSSVQLGIAEGIVGTVLVMWAFIRVRTVRKK